MSPREKIHALLAEPIAAAAERERRTFPTLLRDGDGSVVLFGAGRLGRLCARALRRGGVTLRAICDRNSSLHGTVIEGAIVMGPEEAARQFGSSALFVVSIWTGTARESMVEQVAYLQKLGCRRVTTYAPLVWAHGREETPFHSFDLPTRVLAHAAALHELAGMFDDPVSTATLLAVLRQRLRGRFDPAPPAADQYFSRDVFSLRADEVVVDGGAYTGDTLEEFLARSGSRFHAYHAFEPDRVNLDQLRRRAAALPEGAHERIRIHDTALGATDGPVGFAETGGPTSMVAAGAAGRVAGRTLDAVLANEPITFLKLDVEGGERDALRGARAAIGRWQPLVAVCVYHGPADLWEIPRTLRELLPGHRCFLRQHQFDGYELVFYAVPLERCVRA